MFTPREKSPHLDGSKASQTSDTAFSVTQDCKPNALPTELFRLPIYTGEKKIEMYAVLTGNI